MDRLDDRRHRLPQGFADFLFSDDDRFREAVDEVSPLDLHHAELIVDGPCGAQGDLDLLGLTLAHQQVVVLPDVLDDRLIHFVAREPDRFAVNDTREGNDRHLGRSAADVDNQGPSGSETAMPAPSAAAIGSSIKYTSRAPACIAAVRTARRSTCVMPDGTPITTRGRTIA